MFRILAAIGIIVFLASCSSDNGEDMKIDCSESGIALTLDSKTDPSCDAPGSFEVSASGGAGGFIFSIGSMENSTGSFDALAQGTYVVTVTDENECQESLEVTLAGGDAISLNVSSEICSSDAGEIIGTATGGDTNYTYTLSDGTESSDGRFLDLAVGTYSLTVSDGSGCSFTQEDIELNFVSLADHIMPIIENNCAISGCHLDTRSPLYENSDDVIAAAERIRVRTTAGTMPPSGALDAEDVAMITAWVECGAEDN